MKGGPEPETRDCRECTGSAQFDSLTSVTRRQSTASTDFTNLKKNDFFKIGTTCETSQLADKEFGSMQPDKAAA